MKKAAANHQSLLHIKTNSPEKECCNQSAISTGRCRDSIATPPKQEIPMSYSFASVLSNNGSFYAPRLALGLTNKVCQNEKESQESEA